MSTGADILFVVFEAIPFVIIISIMLGLCFCGEQKPEDADRSGVGAAPAARVAPVAALVAPVAAAPAAEQIRPPAPVVKLPYFPYSQQVRRESEKLVCPICLELFLHGDICSEVPACRHLFHGECIAVWMKNNSSCPLCRVEIAPGSVGVSAADDMV